MATSSHSVTVSPATALSSVVTPGGRVITLPPEVVDMILEQLKEDRGNLSRVMSTSETMFEHAFKLSWKTATLPMLNKLLKAQRSRQRRYAAAIRHMKLHIDPYQILPPLHGIEFPHLQSLNIIYRSMTQSDWAHVKCHLNLAHLMVPSLIELRLTQVCKNARPFHRKRFSTAKFSTSNFLPHLARNCRRLRSLILDAEVFGATSNDLVNVLESCKELRGLAIGWVAGDLTENDTFMHAIRHPRLTCIHWSGSYKSLVKINDVFPKPALANLTDLDMRTWGLDATYLLPHLSSLTTLTLELEVGRVSIFPYLSRMTTLVKLNCRIIDDFRLTCADLEALYPLKNLTHLIFVGNDDLSPPPHAHIASLIQPPSIPCQLHKLEVMFIESEDIWHFQNQLFTIAQAARHLRDLSVAGTLDFRYMASFDPPLFPDLRELTTGLVCDDPVPNTTAAQRATTIGNLIPRIAPKLEALWFHGAHFRIEPTLFEEDVKAAWEAKHENRWRQDQYDREYYHYYPDAPLGPDDLD